ncbi:hypothetical protein LYZ84_03535 [Xanthomonas hortorum pv. pelargonii]|uniref:hypothetical protein n=1 Tax=Xanthomonas hortorum TaxID=56454 RepID=UPI0014594F89|nr:hypothetical protein [Xanthomonas hortorum]MCE4353063.1 hypothetical protein [Xanthomonas hortorum pv. pelargonii]
MFRTARHKLDDTHAAMAMRVFVQAQPAPTITRAATTPPKTIDHRRHRFRRFHMHVVRAGQKMQARIAHQRHAVIA